MVVRELPCSTRREFTFSFRRFTAGSGSRSFVRASPSVSERLEFRELGSTVDIFSASGRDPLSSEQRSVLRSVVTVGIASSHLSSVSTCGSMPLSVAIRLASWFRTLSVVGAPVMWVPSSGRTRPVPDSLGFPCAGSRGTHLTLVSVTSLEIADTGRSVGLASVAG
uniref:(northern house mosquito) hypothetical protein n=1 Tax=Culex pipiens TaxID=7175 RepID=A0A8D8AUU1_CULPI